MPQLLLLALLSMSSFVYAKPCAVLLVEDSVGEQFKDKPDDVALAQAQQWLADYGRTVLTTRDSLLLYRNWQRWNTINNQQRDHTLAMELRLISPTAGDNLFLWQGRTRLQELSRQNLKRMLLQLKIRYPEVSDQATLAKYEKNAINASQLLRFAYGMQLPHRSLDGVNPPLPSPRELLKNELETNQVDYYSALLGGSPSAGFQVRVASGSALMPTGMYLSANVARDQGFVAPYFDSAKSLIAFFAAWDIDALDRVVRENRMSFPFSVRTGRDMLNYFQSNAIQPDQVFPANEAAGRLNALRTKLNEYVLTEEDARTFIAEAFQLYVLSLAYNKDTAYTRLTAESYSRIETNHQIFRKFYEFIGMPGLTLRVPVAAKASDYSIVREIPRRHDWRSSSSPLNSTDPYRNRVNHDSMPR